MILPNHKEKKHEAWRKQPEYPPQTLSRLSFQVDTYASIATQELHCLVNRSFTPHLSLSLSVLKWMSECISIMHLIYLFSSDRHFPISSLFWCSVEKSCVFVCASHPLDCAGKQCEWDRSMRRTDSICTVKDSPGSLRSHVPVVFMQSEGVTEELWLQQANRCSVHWRKQGWTEKQALVVQPEWPVWFPGWGPTICWTDCWAVAWLDAVRTDFVTERSKSKFCVLRHGKPVDWLTGGQTQTRALAQLHQSVLLSALRLLSQRLPPPVVCHLPVSDYLQANQRLRTDWEWFNQLSGIKPSSFNQVRTVSSSVLCTNTVFIPQDHVIVKTSASESFCRKHLFINVSSPHLFLSSHRN